MSYYLTEAGVQSTAKTHGGGRKYSLYFTFQRIVACEQQTSGEDLSHYVASKKQILPPAFFHPTSGRKETTTTLSMISKQKWKYTH